MNGALKSECTFTSKLQFVFIKKPHCFDQNNSIDAFLIGPENLLRLFDSGDEIIHRAREMIHAEVSDDVTLVVVIMCVCPSGVTHG